MVDISEELTLLSTTKKGAEMKEAILTSLKKIYVDRGGEVETLQTLETWSFSTTVTLTNYTYTSAGWALSHTPTEIVSAVATGRPVDDQSTLYVFTCTVGDSDTGAQIYLHGDNGTYGDVEVRISYKYIG